MGKSKDSPCSSYQKRTKVRTGFDQGPVVAESNTFEGSKGRQINCSNFGTSCLQMHHIVNHPKPKQAPAEQVSQEQRWMQALVSVSGPEQKCTLMSRAVQTLGLCWCFFHLPLAYISGQMIFLTKEYKHIVCWNWKTSKFAESRSSEHQRVSAASAKMSISLQD